MATSFVTPKARQTRSLPLKNTAGRTSLPRNVNDALHVFAEMLGVDSPADPADIIAAIIEEVKTKATETMTAMSDRQRVVAQCAREHRYLTRLHPKNPPTQNGYTNGQLLACGMSRLSEGEQTELVAMSEGPHRQRRQQLIVASQNKYRSLPQRFKLTSERAWVNESLREQGLTTLVASERTDIVAG